MNKPVTFTGNKWLFYALIILLGFPAIWYYEKHTIKGEPK